MQIKWINKICTCAFTPCAKTYKPEGWLAVAGLGGRLDGLAVCRGDSKAMKCELLLVQNEVERRNEWAQCAGWRCLLPRWVAVKTAARTLETQQRRQLQGELGRQRIKTKIGSFGWNAGERVRAVATFECQTRVYEPCGVLKLLLRPVTVTGPLRCHGNQKLLMLDGES